MKSRTSIKVRDRKKQQVHTRNSSFNQEVLTELERRVVSIIGMDNMEGNESVSENDPIEEVGLNLISL